MGAFHFVVMILDVNDYALVEGLLWLQRTEDVITVDSIWYCFYVNQRLDDLHTLMIENELSSTYTTEQIMREDSPEIALLQLTLRTFGNPCVISKLAKPIRQIIKCKDSLEIDESRLENKSNLQTNLDSLLEFASWVLDVFIVSPNDVPNEIVKTCQI